MKEIIFYSNDYDFDDMKKEYVELLHDNGNPIPIEDITDLQVYDYKITAVAESWCLNYKSIVPVMQKMLEKGYTPVYVGNDDGDQFYKALGQSGEEQTLWHIVFEKEACPGDFDKVSELIDVDLFHAGYMQNGKELYSKHYQKGESGFMTKEEVEKILEVIR